MDRKTIEKALVAFSFGRLQDFITLHSVICKHNISIMQLENYVKGKRARQTEAIRLRTKMPDCPKCGRKLTILPIKLPKGPLNRKGWKCLWQCQADDCAYEVYSQMTVEDEIKRMGTGLKKKTPLNRRLK